jgi:serine/threonine protein kinase
MSVRIESRAEPIPGYRLIERLGGGGFGEVWKAEAPGGLLKAIKFVYGDLQTVGDADAARAEQELKALSRVKSVRHPFILSLERFDIIDGQLMIVSELADRNLWDRYRECRSQSLPGIARVELLRFLEEAAEALDHMNIELDLMHLDIKPQNLFLVGNHIKVADFGLVKDLEGLVASVTGGVTPVYAAPETFEGYVSRYSDQYSLAIVYQELLTGQRPFTAANTRQLILAHLQAEPDLSSLPPQDRPIVAQALAKDPKARHANSRALIQALLEAKPGPARQPYQPELQDTPFAGAGTTVPSRQQYLSDEPAIAPPTIVPAVTPGGSQRTALPKTGFQQSSTLMGLPEEVGPGVLVPALVIGVGHVGRVILERFKGELRSRVGDPLNVPHIRLMALDSDATPVSLQPDSESLAADETLLARLSRPSRYLRPRDGMPALSDWLDPMMLYRIPRELVTNGVRALGRLAFLDNYRAILSRLRWELEQISNKDTLSVSAERTGFQLRTNWPQVYVITHLGGGTGSGCFLDLAYVVRRVLRELYFGRHDVTGVLVLPPPQDEKNMDLGLANTHAALTELARFMTPGQAFSARYEARVPPLMDEYPPFARCLLFPTRVREEGDALAELARRTSDWMYRELLTPLGRAAAEARGEAEDRGAHAMISSGFQAVGTARIAVPRRALLQRLARRFCRSLIEQWCGKNSASEPAVLLQQMRQDCLGLGADPQTVIMELNAAARNKLEEPPDVAFQKWIAPMRTPTVHGLPDRKHYHAALIEADRTLGAYDPKASDNAPQTATIYGDNPCTLPLAMREAAEQITDRVEPLLVRKVLRFLDVPGQRLGTAEEAINQTILCLEEWLKELEQQQAHVAARLREMPDQIRRDLADCERVLERAQHGTPPSRERRQLALSGLPERIQLFVILRYQQLTLQWAVSVYRSLRGRISDQKKELAYCRSRLKDMHNELKDEAGGTEPLAAVSQVTTLLPNGAKTLDEVVDPCLQNFTTEDAARVDAAIQRQLEGHFDGLQPACQITGHQHFIRWRNVLLQAAQRELESLVKFEDAATTLMANGVERLPDRLCVLHAEAKPGLCPAQGCTVREYALMQAPDTPAGKQLLLVGHDTITGLHTRTGQNPDEVVCYRETEGIMLVDLPQFGPLGKQAYDAAFGVEHFSPHARHDVVEWAPRKKPEE